MARTVRRTTPAYIFVIGGVISGIGKGVSASSIALLLSARGLRTTSVKIDPYLNVDAGTMNPTEHGEVFVTNDGLECDQDIGNYERFVGVDLSRVNYMTSGQVYLSVIDRERRLGYAGKCVEFIPHIPDEVVERLERATAAANADVCVVEVGGTIGEYQNLIYLEAARVMQRRAPGSVLITLVSYFPVPAALGEMKSKPTQMALRMLNEAGLQADIVIARSSQPIDAVRRAKVATNSHLDPADVIAAPDVTSIYEVPLRFEAAGLTDRLLTKLGRLTPRTKQSNLTAWRTFVRSTQRATTPVRIAIVGKYFGTGDYTLSDSYLSVIEAIKHAAYREGVRPEIAWIDAEQYEREPQRVRELAAYDGVLIPGGFGARGVEGKIAAIRYAREQGIPYLGLCYGMQLAAIEFARTVLRLRDAHTTEVAPKTSAAIIDVMAEQQALMEEQRLGGTMRLGAYACTLAPGTRAASAYKSFWKERLDGTIVQERHRHRYEFQNVYRDRFAAAGMIAAGINPERDLVEILELRDHPFFVGTQFHPELQSRPLVPHPLFRAFVRAGIARRTDRS